MIPAPATSFAPADEKDIRRLLASTKPVDHDTLLTWLDGLPTTTAADLLAKLAEGAQRVHLHLYIVVSIAMFAVFIIVCVMRKGYSYPLPFFLINLWGVSIAQRRTTNTVARKAAFLLAHRDDYRAIAPLAKLWDAEPQKTAVALHECEELERALTRLLTALTANKYENLADDAVRDLLSRAFPPLPQRGKSVLSDLSETRADLLLAALRYLAHATPGKESPLTRELVERIAAYPVETFAPNRSLVHETAALCLDPAHRATPLAATAPVAQMAGIR